jgi:hypothetical protein
MSSSSQSLAQASQNKLTQFYRVGLQQGCSRDQLLNSSHAGIILQDRQLAASAAARLCDQPDGPKQHDPDRPGDVLKTNINEDGLGGDDTADALLYMVATKPREVRAVKLRGF